MIVEGQGVKGAEASAFDSCKEAMAAGTVGRLSVGAYKRITARKLLTESGRWDNNRRTLDG
jgi:hypothetical protein